LNAKLNQYSNGRPENHKGGLSFCLPSGQGKNIKEILLILSKKTETYIIRGCPESGLN